VVRPRSSPEKPVAVGDQVLVRSGLDVVPGTVVDQYGDPPQMRLVVRLTAGDDAGSDAPTVVARETDVYPLEATSEVEPPGSWVSGAAFEREVADALRRVALGDLLPQNILVDREPGSTAPDLHIIDLSNGTPGRAADVEVKFSKRPRLAASAVDRIAERFEARPGERGRLLVSNAEVAGSTAGLLRARNIGHVRWRSSEDDSALAESLLQALSQGHPKTA